MFERILEVTDAMLSDEDQTAVIRLLTRAISLRHLGRRADAEACYEAALPWLEDNHSLNGIVRELAAEVDVQWADSGDMKATGNNTLSDDDS